MKKSKGESVLDSTARLQWAARERADGEARRIPWQRLLEVRNQYIHWQGFLATLELSLSVAVFRTIAGQLSLRPETMRGLDQGDHQSGSNGADRRNFAQQLGWPCLRLSWMLGTM